MAYLTKAPLVLVKVPGVGDDYRVDYHYQDSVIPALTAEAAERLVRMGFVEEIGGSVDLDAKPAKTATKPVLVSWLQAHTTFTVDELDAQNVGELRALIDATEV